MKKLLFTLVLTVPFISMAQKSKECKIENLPNAQGKQVEYAVTKTLLGKLMLGKDHGKLVLAYMPKTLLALNTNPNTVNLKLDSATFVFDDATKLTIKIDGVGLANNTIQIKPKMTSCYIGVILTVDQTSVLKTKLITAFQVKGEKESEYGDFINEKDRLLFQKSFSCIE